ncbi:MAG: HAD family phosphatase [Bacteroidota bacterium]|nr:HAD family phosphatase [Bacteroidota bacterium]
MDKHISEIKHLIFDLGNVLLPIDFNAPVKAFQAIGLTDFDRLYGEIQQVDLFNLLETGKISESTFRNEMRRISGLNWTDQQIDDAWSAIILDFRASTFSMLERLAVSYNLYLLSNSNSIHFTRYNQQVIDKFHPDGLNAYFKKAYYSHKMGLRKPDTEIFHAVLRDGDIKANDCLFIDDNEANIISAKALGFNTYHHNPTDIIEDLFN